MTDSATDVAAAWFDNYNNGNFDAQSALVHPDHVFHFPMAPEPLGAEAHVGMQMGFKAAVPDFQLTVLTRWAVGDTVITHWSLTGTFLNEFNGMPPTGDQISATGVNIMTVLDGKNYLERDFFDTLPLLKQMGAM